MTGELNLQETLDNGQFINALGQSEQSFNRHVSNVTKGGNEMNDAMKKVGEMAAIYFSVEQLGEFVKELVNVRGEFQQLGVAFSTMLGSKEKGDKLMEGLVQMARHAPFTLTEIAAGAKQLIAFQVEQEKVNDVLLRLGNISSGLSVPLGQLVHVYGQIKASGAMDGRTLRELTMAGFPIIKELASSMGIAETAVKKAVESGAVSFEQFNSVIEKITNKGGMFFNLMELQSHTLTGKLTNLKDAWDEMLNDMGKNNDGLLAGSIDMAISLTKSYEDILAVIIPLVEAYGAYKAALFAMVALEKAVVAVEFVQNFIEIARATSIAGAAMKAFNLECEANVYIAAAVALAALVAIVYHFASATTKAEDAQKDLDESILGETTNLSIMFDRLKNATAGTKEYQAAKDAIVAKYGEYDNALNTELNTVQGIAKAYDNVSKAVIGAAKARLRDKYTKDASDESASSIADQYTKIRNGLIAELGKDKGSAVFDGVRTAFETGGDWKSLLKKNGVQTEDKMVVGFQGSVTTQTSQVIQGFRNVQLEQDKMKKDMEEFNAILGDTAKAGEVVKGNAKDVSLTYEQQVAKAKEAVSSAKAALLAERKRAVPESEQGDKDKKLTELDGKIKTAQEFYNRLTDSKPTKEKTTGANAPYGTLEYWDAILKKLKDSIALTKDGHYFTKAGTDITGKMENVQATIKDLTPKSFDEEIAYKKSKYAEYYQQILTAGKDVADKQFEPLRENGNTYSAMLAKKMQELQPKIKDGTASASELDHYQKLIAELNGINLVKPEWDGFTETMAKLKTESKSTADYVAKLKEYKAGLKDATEGGKLTPEQKKTAGATIDQTIEKSTGDELVATLAKYRTYKEQLTDIDTKYQSELDALDKARGATEDKVEKERLNQKIELARAAKAKEVAVVGDAMLKETSSYKQLFGDISELGVNALSNIKKKAEAFVGSAKENTAADGTKTYSVDIIDVNGQTQKQEMSEAEYQSYVNKIKEIGGQIAQKNPFKALLDDVEKLSKGGKMDASTFSDVAGALKGVNQIIDSAMKGLDTMGVKVDDQDKKAIADVQGMISGGADLAMGIASGNPIQIIQGSIELISNGIDFIWGANDRASLKAIKKDEDAIKHLQAGFAQLKRAVDDSYGEDYFLKQGKVLENLQAQLKLEKDELSLQQNREGKKRDQTAIDAAKQQALDTANSIQDVYNAMSEKIMSTTGKGFAATLGSSIFDAIKQGSNAFDIIDAKSKEVVQNIVKQWLQTKFLEAPLQNMLTALQGKIATKAGDTLTEADLNTPEAKKAFEDFQNGVKTIGTSYANILGQMNYLFDDNSKASAATGAIKGVTEQTAGYIEGNLLGIRLSQDRQESILGATLKIEQSQLEILQSININSVAMTEVLRSILSAVSVTDNGLRAKGFI